MLSFLNVLRGSQSDFIPEREVRHLRLATVHNAQAGLEPRDSCPADSGEVSAAPDPTMLKAAIDDLKAQLRVADEEATKGVAALENFEDKTARLRAQIKGLKKAKATAEKGQRRLRKRLRLARRNAERRIANLRERLDFANTRAEELTVDNDCLQLTEAELNTELTVVSGRVQDLESKLAASEAEKSLLKEELTTRNRQIEVEKSKLGEAMTLLYLEKEKTKSLEAQVALLKRQLAEKDAFYSLEIDALQLASDMYESQEQDEHHARTTAEQERDAVLTERNQALVDIASLRQIVDNQGARITELKEQYLAETLRSDALMAERDCYLEQLHNLKNALSHAQAQHLGAQQTSTELKKDCQHTQEAYDRLQLPLTLADTSDKILQEKVRGTETANQELRAVMYNKMQDCEAASGESFTLCTTSQECISAPLTSPLPSSGSVSRALPLGVSVSFNIASLVEAAVSPKTLRKTRSSRKFSVSTNLLVRGIRC